MSAFKSRAGSPELAPLVGARCTVTRTGHPGDSHRPFVMNALECQLLRTPQIGLPLWLVAGGSRWVRTSPVSRIDLDELADLVVVVCTRDARYRLVFEPPRPADPIVSRSGAA